MSVLGWVFLGLVVGVALDRGAAWVAATARVMEAEEEHQRDLARLATVQRLREEALRRNMDPDHHELNAWEELRRQAVVPEAKVLVLRDQRRRAR